MSVNQREIDTANEQRQQSTDPALGKVERIVIGWM